MIKMAIVDDDSVFASVIKSKIQHMPISIPYEIEIFSSPVTFLKQEKSYDILILDVKMPEMTGIEMAKRLHNDTDVYKRQTGACAAVRFAIEEKGCDKSCKVLLKRGELHIDINEQHEVSMFGPACRILKGEYAYVSS